MGTGTSQGTPVIGCQCAVCISKDSKDKRLRTSIFISGTNLKLCIDIGPDFRQQMLANNIDELDAILLTHEHNDHIAGMDDVRPFNFKHNKDMPIYATDRVQKVLHERFPYIFEARPYPGAPRVLLKTLSKDKSLVINGTSILPIEVLHGKMSVLGFRIGNFTYITDAKTIHNEEFEKIKGTKYLVLNALHHEEHHSHFNLQEALAIIEEINPTFAYLTHISHQMGKYLSVQETLPKNVLLAYDNLTISVSN